MIESRTLGKKPSETLRRVARYYLDKGYSAKNVRSKLESFMIQCDASVSIPKWSEMLDYALSRAKKTPSINIEAIDITRNEMNRINSVRGRQTRRLAFTLLCLAKYWRVVIPGCDFWVNNKDSEIMALANIEASLRRQSQMYRELRDADMIRFSKKVDNTSVKVCFAEQDVSDETDVVLQVSDFRNLGYQYMMYDGGSYFRCQCCGITTKLKDPRQKYCGDCANRMRLEQNVNSVMRQRYKTLPSYDDSLGVYTVYMHECPNGKRYVGITGTTLERSWENGTKFAQMNRGFYADIVKFGWSNIKHFKTAAVQDRTIAEAMKVRLIHKYHSDKEQLGYNRRAPAVTERRDIDFEKLCQLTETLDNGCEKVMK